MTKLLNANFSRLFFNGIFRVGMLVSVIAGVICPLMGFRLKRTLSVVTEGLIGGDTQYQYIDYYCFTYIWILVVVIAVFCGIYVGTEYSDGTMRNKVAAGYSRTEIYFSNLAVNAVGGVIIYVLYQITDLCVGIKLLGGFCILEMREVAVYVLCACVLMICISAISTMIAMLVSNRAVSVVICIGIVLVFYVIGLSQGTSLANQQYYDEEVVINGITYAAGSENPYYVDGIRRVFETFIFNLLPGGQMASFQSFYQLDPVWAEMGIICVEPLPGVMVLGSVMLAAAATVVGRLLFCRKELK